MKMEICLTNLGKYNEGELVFTRLVLPATTEEIYAAYERSELQKELCTKKLLSAITRLI